MIAGLTIANPFSSNRGGIGSFLTPLINKIGMTYQDQTNEELQQRLDSFKDQVSQLTTETFPEVSFDSNSSGFSRNPFSAIDRIQQAAPVNITDNPVMGTKPQIKEMYNPSAPQADFGAPSYSVIDYSNIERPTADENLKTFEQAMSGQVNQQPPSPQPLNVSGSQPMPSPIFTSGIANIPTNMSNNLFSLLQNRG